MVCMEYLKRNPDTKSLLVPPQESGTIKKLFVNKGFCFITPDVDSNDVFAHVLDNPDLYDCIQGDSIKYDMVWDDGKRKYRAINISRSGKGEGDGREGDGDGRNGKNKGDSKGDDRECIKSIKKHVKGKHNRS